MICLYSEGANRTVVTIGDDTLYFSYNTVVALRRGADRYVTAHSHSKTTAKHITQMRCRGEGWKPIPQCELEALVKKAA